MAKTQPSSLNPESVVQMYAREYGNALMAPKGLFTCITMRDKIFSLYLESPDNSTNLCRVFFKRNDATVFRDSIIEAGGYMESEVKVWQTNPNEIVEALMQTQRKAHSLFMKDIVADAYIIHDNRIYKMETFWTTDHKTMV